MKLFVIATLIAVASAARLEHLEQQRAYLPPFQNQGSFGPVSAIGVVPAGQPGLNAATINQYLPPDQGSSASVSETQFAGSLTGFNAQPLNNQFGAQPGFGPQASNSFIQNRYQAQFGSPNSDPTQNIPQQAFDEQTGYHY